jgi:methionine-gamma-lyase
MPPTAKPPGFQTRAIHAGYRAADAHGALGLPVHMTSTYAFESAEQAQATFAGEQERYVYGRVHNPTQSVLEARLASLEGAEAAVVMASGMGAITSLLWTTLRAGDGLIAHSRMYGNTFTFLHEALPRYGVDVALVDMIDPAALERRISNKTRIVFLECPANPQLELPDIAAIGRIAAQAGARVVVDSTLASPYLLRPLEHGADVVVHSATKYLSGHGDVLGGVVAGSKDLVRAVRRNGLRYMTGATLAPMSVFLVQRGIKTLGLRMDRHCANAAALARYLGEHAKVRRVLYPGLPSHPQHALAARLMAQGGGMLSFELQGGKAAAFRFMNAVRLIHIAVSLGEAETLVQHPASMTHMPYAELGFDAFGLSESVLRISVGLEEIDDIVADVAQALEAV